MFNKKVLPILLVFSAIALSTFTYALPVSECRPKYNDCMDSWFSTAEACYGDYKLCRSSPGGD
ncbi:hypothetical protein [Psychrosphaera haliotis]|uniref:DUF3551 domain-containing protein n=1 Tax=Psychrosphaera haliotis TaxID=555083 RepID=A0A6N8F9H3_9GAMM|nr:hypothetical protein [Psychrosphaera haliotis]MUH72804.1 hypothetical protein [Psychrosphaera haliotis]